MYVSSTSKSRKRKLRRLAKKHLKPSYFRIYSAVTIGPLFKTGHGQSFAYNPKDKHLYNAAYSLARDRGKKHSITIQKLSMSKLRPIKQWKLFLRIRKKSWIKIFGLKIRWPFTDKTKGYLQLHDLTFDKKGNFYFTKMLGRDTGSKVRKMSKRKRTKVQKERRRPKNYKPSRHESSRKYYYGRTVQVYKGKLSRHSAKIHAVDQISNAIGTTSQGLSYDGRNNRLFFNYDSSFMTLPVNKLNKKVSMKSKTMHFTVLTRRNYRESEGMGITSDGKGYMIMNRQAESIKSVGKVS
ncbi:hypothetical protein [Levilactobacillus suantsaiihabitans]|uniref:Uncharacterized protein n=1 Tax=Levilactobacillus suantsaiihabitans TaxID=2487722 RepID=A0A4Z0JA63_9LACO|nr:hypothetical protein [Levilactobacillus suantsaiihabitans]TGD18470.1 hypothetical protein EGT51_08305 [Levilactobacillus suantsaiihabitans]